ncbi:MAG: alpha/beta hydrolase [Candidatus Woesearchaeota archaeon]|jgi:predicted alpha/beta hydrolase family esterase
MVNVLLIGEKNIDANSSWYSWLSKQLDKRGHKLLIFNLDSNDDVNDCLNKADAFSNALDSNSMIIGYGFGVKVALKIIENRVDPVSAAFFIAGSLDDEQYNFESIREKVDDFFVYASDNDSIVNLSDVEHLGAMIGETVFMVPDAMHFDNMSEFEDLLIDILSVLS